jgi:ATP-binding cassette subfamily B (MDR/TAP) protein 8
MIGNIEFKNVCFSYPSRPNDLVLKNVTLSIPAGKVIALCGPSGSGKSTMGQLIERFYDVDQGTILMDGKNIQSLNTK